MRLILGAFGDAVGGALVGGAVAAGVLHGELEIILHPLFDGVLLLAGGDGQLFLQGLLLLALQLPVLDEVVDGRSFFVAAGEGELELTDFLV